MVDQFVGPWHVLFCLWDGAYKRTIAANRRVAHVVVAVGSLLEWSFTI